MTAERSKNGIVGAFVADAATMPLHWIYDREKLKSILGDKVSTPEFFNPPSCPFYNSEKNPGMLGYATYQFVAREPLGKLMSLTM